MTSYHLRTTTPPKSVKKLVGEVVKTPDTTTIPRSTSFTIDSSDSSNPLEDTIDPLETSPTKVSDINKDILRAANNYLQVPALKSNRNFGDYTKTESNSPSMDQVDDYVELPEKSTELDPVQESNPTTQLSLDEIKEMVLRSIPDRVRTSIPAEKWNAVMDEAMGSTLSKEIMSLQNNPTEEDIEDLVSFISIYVQRETRSNPPPVSIKKAKERKSKTGVQMVDALTLILESLPDTAMVQNNDGKLMITKQANDNRATDHNRRVMPPTPTAMIASESIQPRDSSAAHPVTPNIPGYIPKPPTERSIGFSHVQIRYYEQILSDNPSVTSGPPIGIGWKYRVMKQDLSVDAWEYKQQPSRRYMTALLTTRDDRMTLLCNLGYTQREIAMAVRDVLRIKNYRKQSFNNIKLEGFEEAIERTTRTLKSVLTLGMANRQEKKLLGPYKKKNDKGSAN